MCAWYGQYNYDEVYHVHLYIHTGPVTNTNLFCGSGSDLCWFIYHSNETYDSLRVLLLYSGVLCIRMHHKERLEDTICWNLHFNRWGECCVLMICKLLWRVHMFRMGGDGLEYIIRNIIVKQMGIVYLFLSYAKYMYLIVQ